MSLTDPSSLPVAFDAAASSPKLVVLVSPTCPVCLDGVTLVRESLTELEPATVATHIVWLPVLEGDTVESAEDSAMLIEATHYWDTDLTLSKRYRDMLGLEARGRRVAWDLYLLYGTAARWTAEPPMPDVWMQQLRLDDVPTLDSKLLLGHLRQMLGLSRSDARAPEHVQIDPFAARSSSIRTGPRGRRFKSPATRNEDLSTSALRPSRRPISLTR